MKREVVVARKLIHQYNLQCPVDLESLLKKLDIVLLKGDFESNSAMIWQDSEDDIILIDKKQPLGEYRFNLAHEVAHVVLNHQDVIMQVSNNKTYKEQCADAFASELLMPSREIKRTAHKMNFDIKQLMSYFKVSEKAMVVKMRILNLDYYNTQYD